MNLVTTAELTKSLNVTPQRIAAISKQLKITEEETVKRGRSKHYLPSAVKKILEHRGFNYCVKETISFCNNKGGVGKTSLAINTASRLSSLGFKVLLIDADSQSNSTSFFLDQGKYDHVLYDVVVGRSSLQSAIISIDENLDLIPSSLLNSRLDSQLTTLQVNQRTYFSKMLEGLDYNYIIWDLSPSISTTNFLALLSCSQVNIVTTLSDFSVQGLEMTYEVINQAKVNFPDYHPKTRALINMFDSRITSSLEHLTSIKNSGVDLYEGIIRIDNTISKTQTSKAPLTSSSNAHKDIASFVNEIIDFDKKISIQ